METYPFVKVEDTSRLLPILENRLPQSCMTYNSCIMYPRFVGKTNSAFYTLNGDIDQSSWIVFSHYREDWGQDYLISGDEKTNKFSKDELFQIFSTSKLFNWDEPYFFGATELWFSDIIFDISINAKGNITEVHPCNLYYKDREECINCDVKLDDPEPNVELKRLDPELGTRFIVDTWKYAVADSDITVRKVITENESAGVYVDGKVVCGVIVQGIGMLSALYTLEAHRKKGYAKACMKFGFKELAKNGMVPASTVELRNVPSLRFHENLGCKVAARVNYILSTKHEF